MRNKIRYCPLTGKQFNSVKKYKRHIKNIARIRFEHKRIKKKLLYKMLRIKGLHDIPKILQDPDNEFLRFAHLVVAIEDFYNGEITTYSTIENDLKEYEPGYVFATHTNAKPFYRKGSQPPLLTFCDPDIRYNYYSFGIELCFPSMKFEINDQKHDINMALREIGIRQQSYTETDTGAKFQAIVIIQDFPFIKRNYDLQNRVIMVEEVVAKLKGEKCYKQIKIPA